MIRSRSWAFQAAYQESANSRAARSVIGISSPIRLRPYRKASRIDRQSMNNDLTPAPSEATTPLVRRAGRRKILIGVAGGVAALLLLGVLFAPAIIASMARGKILATLRERIGGTVDVESFSMSWSGTARIERLLIRRNSRDAVAVERVELNLSLSDALAGRLEGNGRVVKPVVTMWRESDGRWNLAAMMIKPSPKAD